MIGEKDRAEQGPQGRVLWKALNSDWYGASS